MVWMFSLALGYATNQCCKKMELMFSNEKNITGGSSQKQAQQKGEQAGI
jgi:hypothetical protein